MNAKAIQETEILLYTTPDRRVKIDVLHQSETIWLTQKRMAELFGVQVPAVNKHLKNIFESEELVQNSVISILEITASDGKKYEAFRVEQDKKYLSDFDRLIEHANITKAKD